MEPAGCTPNFSEASITQDSGFASSVEASYLLLSSTPLSHSSSALRKRKRCDENAFQPPSQPQFSSTLDESLIKNINQIDLETKSCGTPSKRFSSGYHSLATIKEGGDEKIVNPNVTPCKCSRIGTSSIAESPGGDYSQLLHPELKQVQAKSTPKKVDFDSDVIRSDFVTLINNPIILNKISENLSNGALHRFSETSADCKVALLDNPATRTRVGDYKKYFKGNKENVIITPPSSPNNSGKDSGGSPPSSLEIQDEKFKAFVENGKKLKENERQSPCLHCKQPSVVSNNIAQCTRLSCGAIMCLKCWSCSMTGPKDFRDRCGGARLILDDVINKSPQKRASGGDFLNSVSFVHGRLFGECNQLVMGKSTPLGTRKSKRGGLSLVRVVANSPPRKDSPSSDGSNSPPSPPRKIDYQKRKRALKRLSFPDN